MKLCNKCDLWKPISCFSKSMANKKDGLQNGCKDCANAYNKSRWVNSEIRENARGRKLLSRYGITPEDYSRMLLEQKGSCKICGTEDPHHISNNSKYFCVDHCHTTGKVRGLLCNNCNVAIARFKDNIDSMEKAILYIKESI
jgi:hypothetical protein